MFMLNKSEMNSIMGGKSKCYIYNRETGSHQYIYYATNDLEEARNLAINEFGAPHNIVCWLVADDTLIDGEAPSIP